MPELTHTIDIAATPEQVFAVVEDTDRTPEWQRRCTRIDKLTDGPAGVGTELRYHFKDGPRTGVMQGRVTAADPRRRFAMSYNDKAFTVDVDFVGEPVAGGTRLTHTIRIAPHGFARLFTPFITRTLPKQTVTSMEQLKAVVESDAGTPAAPA